MKAWSPQHLYLARCTADARDLLRRILPALSPEHRRLVGMAIGILNRGLKARGTQEASSCVKS